MIPFPVPFFRRAGPSGGPAFVQAVFSDSIVVTAELPVDDTVPLITEGAEILSLTVTPQSAASRFLIEAAVYASPKFFRDISADFSAFLTSSTRAWAAALFRGTTCIQVHAVEAALEDPAGSLLRMAILDQPATAATVTWSVRVGPSQHFFDAGSPSPGMGLRVNGEFWQVTIGGTVDENRNHRMFGGAAKSTLTVQELP